MHFVVERSNHVKKVQLSCEDTEVLLEACILTVLHFILLYSAMQKWFP